MTFSDFEAALSAAGLKFANVLAGAASSFAALRFFDGLGRADRWTTFVGGWAAAAWGGPPLSEWLELPQRIEVGMVLLIGFFGMAVAAEAIKVVRTTNWSEVLKSAIDFLLRRKSP